MRTQKSDSSKTAPYGRQHARTAELYRQRREERARAQQQAAETPPPDMLAVPTNVMAPPKETVEQPVVPRETPAPANKARQAVASVLQVAREAHPIASARKLAGTVVTGAVRVAREVSARAMKAKRPGKKA